jgi:hypothetical protein
MTNLARLPICLLSGLLFAGGGCARTDDGSVVIPRQIDSRRLWEKDSTPPQTPPVLSGSNVFPVVEQPRRFPRSRAMASAPATAPNESTVSCGTALTAGERVRVVCE